MLLRNPKLTLTLGMLALIVSSVLSYAQRHWIPGLSDALLGFFYGVAIGLLLLSVWQRSRATR